jgi:hypothetical protein
VHRGANFTAVDTPSKLRITEGISGLERVCDNNIEAKGCIVSDENFRTGRRARKVHGEGGRNASPPSAHHTRGGLRGPSGVRGWAGRRRRGLRSVLAEFKISDWGGTQEAINSWSSLPKKGRYRGKELHMGPMDLGTKPQVDRLRCCRERPVAASRQVEHHIPITPVDWSVHPILFCLGRKSRGSRSVRTEAMSSVSALYLTTNQQDRSGAAHALMRGSPGATAWALLLLTPGAVEACCKGTSPDPVRWDCGLWGKSEDCRMEFY